MKTLLIIVAMGIAGCAAKTAGSGKAFDAGHSALIDFGVKDAAFDAAFDDSVEDLGTRDLGIDDVVSVDLGAFDLGSPDLGSPDVGSPDVGSPDLGSPDLGPPDLGASDLGAAADASVCAAVFINPDAVSDDDVFACGLAMGALGGCYVVDARTCPTCACDYYVRAEGVCDASGTCSAPIDGTGCVGTSFTGALAGCNAGNLLMQGACAMRYLIDNGHCD